MIQLPGKREVSASVAPVSNREVSEGLALLCPALCVLPSGEDSLSVTGCCPDDVKLAS